MIPAGAWQFFEGFVDLLPWRSRQPAPIIRELPPPRPVPDELEPVPDPRIAVPALASQTVERARGGLLQASTGEGARCYGPYPHDGTAEAVDRLLELHGIR